MVYTFFSVVALQTDLPYFLQISNCIIDIDINIEILSKAYKNTIQVFGIKAFDTGPWEPVY